MTLSAINVETNPPDAIAINNDQLIEMTNELLISMLGMEVTDVTSAHDELPDFDSPAWQSSVCIAGDWAAEVQAIIPEKLAERITSTMFSMSPDELTQEEQADAMGEIANIIGGNVKGIVGLESQLKLPCIGKFAGEPPENPDLCLAFDCGGDRLIVCVTEQTPNA